MGPTRSDPVLYAPTTMRDDIEGNVEVNVKTMASEKAAWLATPWAGRTTN